MDYFRLYYTKVKLGTPPVDFTSRLTPTMIFSGLVAALALVVHKQVFCRLSSNILTLYIHQHRPQSPVQTKGATLKLVTVRTISVLTISNMERCSDQRSGYFTKYDKSIDRVFGFGHQEISVISQLLRHNSINQRSGYFTKYEKAVDGVFGFGHQKISVISQLSGQGVTPSPRVFSHCLRENINGGGSLVLGEIVESDIVYTPLVPSH
ncbi:hypothetical protein P8452_10253 [Trifolium repens]|nr:hypothetical protein P8452_10253 [Trifolium repens]